MINQSPALFLSSLEPQASPRQTRTGRGVGWGQPAGGQAQRQAWARVRLGPAQATACPCPLTCHVIHAEPGVVCQPGELQVKLRHRGAHYLHDEGAARAKHRRMGFRKGVPLARVLAGSRSRQPAAGMAATRNHRAALAHLFACNLTAVLGLTFGLAVMSFTRPWRDMPLPRQKATAASAGQAGGLWQRWDDAACLVKGRAQQARAARGWLPRDLCHPTPCPSYRVGRHKNQQLA